MYVLLEAVAYLAYQSKRSEYVAMAKKLCGNKYADTLAATSSMKGGGNQGFILDALASIFTDSDTQLDVEVKRKKRDRLIEIRQLKQEEQVQEHASNPLLAVLELGPREGQSSTFSSTEDGTGRRTQTVESKDCPRSVPPFPFRAVGYEEPESQKALLREVWGFTEKIKEKVKSKRAKRSGIMNDEGDGEEEDDEEEVISDDDARMEEEE
jgi:hypothetical protein